MTPTRHPFGQHLATCSGPDNCAEYAAILAMSRTEYVRYLTTRNVTDLEGVTRRAELRAGIHFAASQATVDQQRAIGLELRRRDSGFMQVLDADVATGTGTYAAFTDGKQTTKKFTFDA